MRDGIQLRLDVFRSPGSEQESGNVPTILMYGPYGKSGAGPQQVSATTRSVQDIFYNSSWLTFNSVGASGTSQAWVVIFNFFWVGVFWGNGPNRVGFSRLCHFQLWLERILEEWGWPLGRTWSSSWNWWLRRYRMDCKSSLEQWQGSHGRKFSSINCAILCGSWKTARSSLHCSVGRLSLIHGESVTESALTPLLHQHRRWIPFTSHARCPSWFLIQRFHPRRFLWYQ